MTKNKKEKKLIRDHAAKTGVRYTTAMRSMRAVGKRASKNGAVATLDPTAMKAAFDFPLDHILARYMKDNGVEKEDANVRLFELRRYLCLAANHPGSRWPMVSSLDSLWHIFLLFTRDYQQYCKVLGVHFIHHQPFGEVVDYDENQRNYEEFLTAYRSCFGAPREDIWPESLDNSNCADCGQQCQGQCANSD